MAILWQFLDILFDNFSGNFLGQIINSMFIPLIGITMYGKNPAGDYSLQSAYVNAVRAAGGSPLLLPPGESNPDFLIAKLDGIILAGGGDIEPEIYQGQPHTAVYAVDSERDCFELQLAKLALGQNMPILGICRGLQVLNVADGGNLVAHVPDIFGTAVSHRDDIETKSTIHSVEVAANSKVAIALGVTNTEVTSWHHQAVLNVASSWKIVATAPDGVIEAIEHKTHPWAIAVQWHPEMSCHESCQKGLFKALVKAAHLKS